MHARFTPTYCKRQKFPDLYTSILSLGVDVVACASEPLDFRPETLWRQGMPNIKWIPPPTIQALELLHARKGVRQEFTDFYERIGRWGIRG